MSLRRRVTLTALIVLGIVLTATGLVVKAVFDAQAERSLDTLLNGRAQLAQQLARQNVAPAALVRRVDADGLRVTLRLRTGQQFGEPETAPSGDARQVRATLANGQRTKGAELVLSADTSLLSGASRTLERVLLIAGLSALAVTALALVLGMRVALAPLDAMTGLARSIAGGDRGRRLQPGRTDTELGRTAAAFDEMLDSLEDAEQLARDSEDRMSRFVADAAHELRTPIAGVQVAAEALRELGPEASAEDRERLQLLLVREARRAGALVGDLLELARIDAGIQLQPEPVRLRELAEAEADRLELLAPELTVRVHGDSPLVDADPGRITQILANLGDNARRATEGRGTVELILGATPDHAWVVVQDDGPGVPEQDRLRIFDRLVHGDSAGSERGWGLGLPIARGFAWAHGGELECLPRADGRPGAAFRLTLQRFQTPTNPSSRPL